MSRVLCLLLVTAGLAAAGCGRRDASAPEVVPPADHGASRATQEPPRPAPLGPPSPAGASVPQAAAKGGKVVTTASGLKYQDIVVGTGARPQPGRTVTVHYIGTFPDGSKFDSSRDRGEPYAFTIGRGEVIPGWDEGVMSMKVGGRRKLTVPANLAYGPEGRSGIPPNATLLFDVELLDVQQ